MDRLIAPYVKSKKEMKREAKYHRSKDLKKEHRKNQRKIKKSRKSSQKSDLQNIPRNPSLNGEPREKTRKEAIELFRQNAKDSNFVVVFDLSFANLMPDRKINSLLNQLGHCYATNKRSWAKPAKVIWAGLDQRTNAILEPKQMPLGQWMIEVTDKHWRDLFDLERVIYLSPDAEDNLEAVEDGAVYIIGGLVDSGNESNLTAQIARELGVKCAKFPLERFKETTMGKLAVFTVNQAFEVLVRIHNGKGWKETLRDVMPQRKTK